jgi:RNA polymerase sigma factor (sigma-70 family)
MDSFEQHRPRLRDLALRMLGSAAEADDVVQEAWLRLQRAQPPENPGGWLTTVTARICLDQLRARRPAPEPQPEIEPPQPDSELQLSDAVGVAMLTVLDALTPNERVAFVLHDVFDLPFEEISSIAGVSVVAARQLASRGRRTVRGKSASADKARQRELVDAFLVASRTGDLSRLLSLLAPDAVLRADAEAVAIASRAGPNAPRLAAEVHGAAAIAEALAGRARGARPATVLGEAGAAWIVDGAIRSGFAFTFDGDRIASIDVVVNPATLAELEISPSSSS